MCQEVLIQWTCQFIW